MEETGRNGEEMERTLVWGHRGASGYAPENTMAAFEKAVEMGADGIELDVQLTKDGELVVIHDETIDRVSDGSGWVKDYTYAKLIKHNFNRTHPEYEHAQIPTLEETLMRKKNLERIKIPVLIFIAGNDQMVDNRAIAVFENRVETAALVCMPASKHEIFNADYQTRCRYYQEIFDFILQNRREKHETEIK